MGPRRIPWATKILPHDDSPQAKTSLLEELSRTSPCLRQGTEPSRLARKTESYKPLAMSGLVNKESASGAVRA